jgi:quinol monooxygenase YgiN
MLVVAGRIPVKAERRADAVRLALAVAAATRAEPGCRAYRFYADLDDPNTFVIFEEWEDEAALGRHFETPHMATFMQEAPALVAGAFEITRYEVSSAAPM